MYKTLAIEIVGTAPLLMHNGQTADPLNKFARALKEVSGKRAKTENDYLEMARIEFAAGLYVDDDGPVLPSRMLEACIIEGARKSKLGKLALAGVIVEKHAPLIYDGPRDTKAMFDDERFRFAIAVRIGQQKIIRTRPKFDNWIANVEISYLADVINVRDLKTAIKNAGNLCGLGDWRPRYGRFALREDLPQAMAAE